MLHCGARCLLSVCCTGSGGRGEKERGKERRISKYIDNNLESSKRLEIKTINTNCPQISYYKILI